MVVKLLENRQLLRQTKARMARTLDPATMRVARDAHLLGRHRRHPEDFAMLCYLCKAFLTWKRARR